MTNDRNIAATVARSLCAAVLLCTTAGAAAQAIYRDVDAEGRSTFTDRPPAPASAEPDLAARPARGPHVPSRLGASVDAKEAARRLQQAQLKRKQGSQPMPGERMQGATSPAVNYRYWRRQERLRQDVEQAQRRSNETTRPQVAGR